MSGHITLLDEIDKLNDQLTQYKAAYKVLFDEVKRLNGVICDPQGYEFYDDVTEQALAKATQLLEATELPKAQAIMEGV